MLNFQGVTHMDFLFESMFDKCLGDANFLANNFDAAVWVLVIETWWLSSHLSEFENTPGPINKSISKAVGKMRNSGFPSRWDRFPYVQALEDTLPETNSKSPEK